MEPSMPSQLISLLVQDAALRHLVRFLLNEAYHVACDQGALGTV